MLCCGYTLTYFPISTRLTSLALWQSNDCPSASKATLMNMDKYFMWIHYERLHNHNKAKHNKTVCIFLGIHCIICKEVGAILSWFSFLRSTQYMRNGLEHITGNAFNGFPGFSSCYLILPHINKRCVFTSISSIYKFIYLCLHNIYLHCNKTIDSAVLQEYILILSVDWLYNEHRWKASGPY